MTLSTSDSSSDSMASDLEGHNDAPSLGTPNFSAKTSFVAPHEAYLHASNRRGDIERLLEDGGYTGRYSIHAGFNHRSIELQKPIQEIYIALENEVSDDLCASLEKAVEPFSCHVVVLSMNSLAEETLKGESSRLGGYTLEEQQASGEGSGSGNKRKGRSEGRGPGRSRDGGSGGGDDGSDDSEDDDDNDNRGKGGDRRGGGKGHGNDDPGSDDSGDRTKRVDERPVAIIPIDSTLEVQDGAQEFGIRSTIKATIRTEGRLNHHWPGQTIEVDIQPLQVDLKTFADSYRVGLGQIQISAPSSSEMTVVLTEPELIEHDEPFQGEERVKRSFKASLSASSTPAKAKISHESSKTVRSNLNSWAVSSHTPRRRENVDIVGMVWNYLPNPDKHFASTGRPREQLSPGPTLLYGLDQPFVYP
ncbi:hypothetical protein H0H92_010497, partial [Tricholoma furcatifolium]